jgi:hypothetical protein
MPSCPIRFKPNNTQWVRCETEIAFDCDEAPESVDDSPYGLVGFGFIFAHKYDIKTRVESSERESCFTEGCADGIRYRGQLLVKVVETVGLGFGAGAGTVAIGFPSRPKRSVEPFVTDCICCRNQPKAASEPFTTAAAPSSVVTPAGRATPALDVIAVTLATAAIAGGLVLANAHPFNAPLHYFQNGVYGLTSLAFVGAAARVMLDRLTGPRRRDREEDNPPKTPVAMR